MDNLVVEAAQAATMERGHVEALGEHIAEQAAHLDAATHRLLTDLRSFDAARGWYRQGARSCAAWLSWRLGWSGNRAREHVRVAQRLGSLPAIDEALRKGELSYCKVRAMTRVATAANEQLLLEDARFSTGHQLELICRKYAMVRRASEPRSPADDAERRRMTRYDLDDGMVGIRVLVHPDEAIVITEALAKVVREHGSATTVAGSTRSSSRTQEQPRFSMVDALVEVCEAVVRGDRPERSATEIVVTVPASAIAPLPVDEATSVAASAAATNVATAVGFGVAFDGTCVSAETSRRLACDAGLVILQHDDDGNPLSVGRKTRTIHAALKRALLDRDKTCRFPGCTNRRFLDGHHCRHWADGGETALENLLALCRWHHRFVHEYGFRIELDDAQQPRFFDRGDRLIPHVPSLPHLVEVGAAPIHRMNEPLAITAATNLPGWDGRPVNYSWVIDDLVRADRLA